MNELIINLVNICIVPILGVLTTYIVKFINSKITSIEDENFKRFLQSSLDEVHQAVDTAVADIAQTYVDNLKKEGKFTPEEQKHALTMAYERALSILSIDTIAFLNHQLTSDGFTQLINSKIEQAVVRSKSNGGY